MKGGYPGVKIVCAFEVVIFDIASVVLAQICAGDFVSKKSLVCLTSASFFIHGFKKKDINVLCRRVMHMWLLDLPLYMASHGVLFFVLIPVLIYNTMVSAGGDHIRLCAWPAPLRKMNRNGRLCFVGVEVPSCKNHKR